jgi:dTDP-L-rhamnose 4-epimerase
MMLSVPLRRALTIGLRDATQFNVGSGEPTTVLNVATQINAHYGGRSEVEITGAFRDGDIRHGMANLAMARRLLKYSPQWKFQDGLKKFLEWANESEPVANDYEKSLAVSR